MSTVEVSLYDNCILQGKQPAGATAEEVDSGWEAIARIAADLDSYFMLVDLTEASRPQGQVRARLRRHFAEHAPGLGHVAAYTGGNSPLRVAIQFVLEGLGLRSYSVHDTREEAVEAIIGIRGGERSKEQIARLAVEHLLEIHAGRCPITDEAIEAERDSALKQVLTALLCVYEAHGKPTEEMSLEVLAPPPDEPPPPPAPVDERLVERAAFFDDGPVMLARLALPVGRILDCNRAFAQMLGYEDEQLVGRLLLDLVHPTGSEETANGLLVLLQTGAVEDLDVEMQCKDGSKAELVIASSAVVDESAKLQGCRIVMHDVRPHYDQAPEVVEDQQVDDEVEEESGRAEIEELASQASHDLQEPLRRVATYAERLREHFAGRIDDQVTRYVDHISEGVSSMQRLVTSVLDYRRISQSTLPLRPVDASDPLNRALENLHAAIEESGAAIESAELPVVLGDQPQLVQLFQNLLGNAIKYGGKGREKVHVAVSARRSGYRWEFSVRDNGAGMAKDRQQRIFELFGQPALPGANGGSGIGLAIAKRVVDRHGGQIWIESELGAGTTVYFTLPAATTTAHGGAGSAGGSEEKPEIRPVPPTPPTHLPPPEPRKHPRRSN